MPAFSETTFKRRAATFATAAPGAQETARLLRAYAEQHIIDNECRATKLALSQDRVAWRAYWRERSKPAESFVPYLT